MAAAVKPSQSCRGSLESNWHLLLLLSANCRLRVQLADAVARGDGLLEQLSPLPLSSRAAQHGGVAGVLIGQQVPCNFVNLYVFV